MLHHLLSSRNCNELSFTVLNTIGATSFPQFFIEFSESRKMLKIPAFLGENHKKAIKTVNKREEKLINEKQYRVGR